MKMIRLILTDCTTYLYSSSWLVSSHTQCTLIKGSSSSSSSNSSQRQLILL